MLAVFIGDTKNFHKYAVYADDDSINGTIYIRKNGSVPKKLNLSLSTRGDKGWKKAVETLCDRAQGKQKARLQKVLNG
jgi:hypothetical protein